MPEDIQIRFANLPSRQMDDLQPSDGSGAFLADILALPAGQVQQKIIKASIAATGPVKLTVLPDQPPGRLEKRNWRLLHTGPLVARKAVLPSAHFSPRHPAGRGRVKPKHKPRTP